ncbi:MAG: hypothetical protein IPJ61_05285 [Tessaracoccus sp.]|uniref:hypothetical protein n=1 Tax=Tessaracoccus sp. TaxID=1971211 RepID=UPI001EB80BF2|nr:hypothetical protein [Tessaracoccus sp.]MBK7820488.1 hypothetical protein [Tessaracoccus sp.]
MPVKRACNQVGEQRDPGIDAAELAAGPGGVGSSAVETDPHARLVQLEKENREPVERTRY